MGNLPQFFAAEHCLPKQLLCTAKQPTPLSAGMARLGNMYHAARGGMPADNAQAVTLYRKAADVGDMAGMSNLGYMYEYGFGVAKDLAQAMTWYAKAAALGSSKAKDALQRLRPAVPNRKPQNRKKP